MMARRGRFEGKRRGYKVDVVRLKDVGRVSHPQSTSMAYVTIMGYEMMWIGLWVVRYVR